MRGWVFFQERKGGIGLVPVWGLGVWGGWGVGQDWLEQPTAYTLRCVLFFFVCWGRGGGGGRHWFQQRTRTLGCYPRETTDLMLIPTKPRRK